jgi:hypothetical protein
MSHDHKIGAQVTRFEEPDIIFMKLTGDVSDDEGIELNLRHREFGKGREHVFFLIDLEKLDKLPPAVRKASTETLRDLPTRGIAIYRAPFKAKVIAKMIITALNFFRGEESKHAVEFADSEAAARSWIEAQRAKLAEAA